MNTTEGEARRITDNAVDSVLRDTTEDRVNEWDSNWSFNKKIETILNMVTYIFYCKKEHEEDSLIGILKERRKDKRRVTRKSIMRWGKLAAGGNVDPKSIYYVKLDL